MLKIKTRDGKVYFFEGDDSLQLFNLCQISDKDIVFAEFVLSGNNLFENELSKIATVFKCDVMSEENKRFMYLENSGYNFKLSVERFADGLIECLVQQIWTADSSSDQLFFEKFSPKLNLDLSDLNIVFNEVEGFMHFAYKPIV